MSQDTSTPQVEYDGAVFAHTMFLNQMESYTQKNTTKRLVVIGGNDFHVIAHGVCMDGRYEALLVSLSLLEDVRFKQSPGA